MRTDRFMDYLRNEKKMSENSLEAYRRDVEDFDRYCASKGKEDLIEVNNADVVAYLMELRNNGKSAATVNRKLASIRALYKYFVEKGMKDSNPTTNIKSPRIERKTVEYLTVEEVERLLSSPDNTMKGKRDRAILEILYATGVRVNELIAANVEDVYFKIYRRPIISS